MMISRDQDARVAIVGCGSLGSDLAMTLAKSGVKDFLLVDKEDLAEENVARHLCGLRDVADARKKTKAVKRALENHLPFVDCKLYSGDVLEMLIKDPDAFDGCRLVIVATADTAVERRISDFCRSQKPLPTVYCWLEPHGVGGQLLYISPEKGGCYRCCLDPAGQFSYPVAAPDQQLERREAGCQNTFTPYGAADLHLFSAIASKWVLSIIEDKPEQSMRYTWIGDVKRFETMGHRIADNYTGRSAYTEMCDRILPSPDCESCQQEHQTAGTQTANDD